MEVLAILSSLNPQPERLIVATIARTLLIAIVILAGCDVPSRPPLNSSDIPRTPAEKTLSDQESKPDVLETPGDSFNGQWETWDAYFVGEKQVGYSHVLASSADLRATADVRYELENVILLNQGRSQLLQKLTQSSIETHDGRLTSFAATQQVGPCVTRFDGALSDQNLQIETSRGSAKTVRKIPWQSTFRGLVAVEQSLRARPMTTAGEKRNLMMLMPGSYELAKVQLTCLGKAAVPLMDGTMRQLIEINNEIEIGDEKSYSSIWINDAGEIVRTLSPSLNLLSYRTDQATATRLEGIDSSVVRVNVTGKLDRSSEAKRLALKITPTALTGTAKNLQTPFSVPTAPGQYVRPADDGSFQVLISRKPEVIEKGFLPFELPPTEDDLKPNYFIDSTASFVSVIAKAALAARELDQSAIADELTRTTKTMIVNKTALTGLTRASDVARDLVADSTGHATLLAALLRSRGIHSRVVFGLKYVEGQPNRMDYHAWTIAWIDDQWVHLDATLGSRAPADRIVLATSNLSGGNEYDALIPFLKLIGQLNITIVAVQY
jgi:transglutaminase-like putative cysteine protease